MNYLLLIATEMKKGKRSRMKGEMDSPLRTRVKFHPRRYAVYFLLVTEIESFALFTKYV